VIVLSILAALLLALVASQLFLPQYLEHRIESRLTAAGGNASVTLAALPALRLLAGDGDRLAIEGHNLRFPLQISQLRSRSLDRIDGFDKLDLRLRNTFADPFRVDHFDLTRTEGEATYQLELSAATSAGALLAYGSGRLPGVLASLTRGAAGTLPRDRRVIAVDMEARLASEGGRPRVVSARGTIGGLQVGPLVELVAGALLSRV
jgi:hypothetical protein